MTADEWPGVVALDDYIRGQLMEALKARIDDVLKLGRSNERDLCWLQTATAWYGRSMPELYRGLEPLAPIDSGFVQRTWFGAFAGERARLWTEYQVASNPLIGTCSP